MLLKEANNVIYRMAFRFGTNDFDIFYYDKCKLRSETMNYRIKENAGGKMYCFYSWEDMYSYSYLWWNTSHVGYSRAPSMTA